MTQMVTSFPALEGGHLLQPAPWVPQLRCSVSCWAPASTRCSHSAFSLEQVGFKKTFTSFLMTSVVWGRSTLLWPPKSADGAEQFHASSADGSRLPGAVPFCFILMGSALPGGPFPIHHSLFFGSLRHPAPPPSLPSGSHPHPKSQTPQTGQLARHLGLDHHHPEQTFCFLCLRAFPWQRSASRASSIGECDPGSSH